MKKNGFGFGIVGAGVIANFHAKAIAAIPEASLAGVCARDMQKAESFASLHRCAAFATVEEMLANPAIDIVCICTPSGAHMEPALKSIDAGKHCLIEKPLEITLERCDRIIAAAQKSDVKVGVIFPSRFSDANKQVKAALEEGRYGTLVIGEAHVKWNRSFEYYQSGSWRGTWQLDGGGAMMNQGIHSVDLLQWFMGPVTTVQAIAGNRKHMNIEVEDTISALLGFSSGALGMISCSTAIFPGFSKRTEILGTAGSSIVEEDAIVGWQFENETPADEQLRKAYLDDRSFQGGASDPAAISYAGHQKQIEDMIDAITTGSAVMVDAAEGRKSVEIVLAAYASALTGSVRHLR